MLFLPVRYLFEVCCCYQASLVPSTTGTLNAGDRPGEEVVLVTR
jgi:hypothetical protein